MFKNYTIFFLSVAFFIQVTHVRAATDTFLVHTDLPIIGNEEKLLLDIFYSADSTFKGDLYVQFYKYEINNDSILVLNKRQVLFPFKKGINKTKLDFTKSDTDTYCAPKFYEILKRTNSLSPGSYKAFITVIQSGRVYQTVYLHEVDSVLSASSPVRKDINKALKPKSISFMGMHMQNKQGRAAGGIAMLNAKSKVDKAIRKRGLTSLHHQRNGKSYVDVYYHDWFAGRYEVKNNTTLSSQIRQQEDKASTPNLGSVTSNSLGSPSLFSQFKMFSKERKNDDEVKGQISFNTNLSSGQEQNSDVDNNYYEVSGMIELPILGIQMQVEGLYTSQDNHRKIKSSYFRVHYNVDKVKDDLLKSISAYNTKFAETKSKGMGMEQVYRSSISNLEGQKSRLQNEISSAEKFNAADITPDHDDADTSGGNAALVKETAEKAKSEATEKMKKLEEKRKQVEALDKRIKKYETLLAQYKNTNFFDSSLGYAKTKDINSYSNMSYKQMAKKGTNILPEGKAKSALSGITMLDAGMFPKYESKYTMSGQMMKGLDVGYDLGFCEAGATVGKTEYVGRDGNLDKYTCYSGRTAFKPAKDQKISLLYYGYTADKKMYSGDGFFSNVSISTPGFFQPVHIVSAHYDGSVTKFVTVGAESAASFKNSDEKNEPLMALKDKMAYHFNAEGNIPNTAVSLEATYDKTGKGFENNTLPMILKGTEQYRLAGTNDFFHSFVTVGVEFNRLIQSSFATGSSNTKWGFDIRTNFKQYPNVSLSYKPFTTFHSYTDTLNIPQRPLLGSVWTGKATYQVKKHDRSLRFMVLYNKSATIMDTSKYGNNLMQASCIYSEKKITGSLSLGYMQLTGTDQAIQTTPNNTKFLNLAISYSLNKQLSVSGGQDFGLAAFGFCRYSANGGIMYRPGKAPLVLRANMRFNTYKLTEGENWKQLYSGNLEMTYRFKNKIKS